jgi:putative spermidine/putrescine transport system permease protein
VLKATGRQSTREPALDGALASKRAHRRVSLGPQARRRAHVALWLAWPSLVLFGTLAIPFALLLRISFAAPDPSGLWRSVLTLDAYSGLLNREFAGALLYSLAVALLVAAITVALGFPLTYLITRMTRRLQVAWLVFLLVSLTLSDVLNAFSWQLMLSKHGGLSGLLVLLGILSRPESLTPSNGAVWASLVYGILPFTVMTLYPSLSQLAPEIVEAARTLGASPLRAFRTVVIPMMRQPALAAFVISTVLTLGAYVSPIVLGRPQSWTLAVLIGNAALAGHDVPRAAAMSVCLLGAVTLLGAVAVWIARGRAAR